MDLFKTLRRQKGTPFIKVDETQAAPVGVDLNGFDLYHYATERKPTKASTTFEDKEIQVEPPVVEEYNMEPPALEQAEESVANLELPPIEEVCEPEPQEETVDLVACMSDGFHKVVQAVQAIKIEIPVPVSPTPVESLITHSVAPRVERKKNFKVKVTNRDRNNYIDTVDIQEY